MTKPEPATGRETYLNLLGRLHFGFPSVGEAVEWLNSISRYGPSHPDLGMLYRKLGPLAERASEHLREERKAEAALLAMASSPLFADFAVLLLRVLQSAHDRRGRPLPMTRFVDV